MVALPSATEPATPRSTLGPYRVADYLALPDEPRCELLFGELLVTTSPTTLHQVVIGWLYKRLCEWADPRERLAVLSPHDVVLAEHTVVQPDVMVYCEPRRDDGESPNPALVVEVLSPTSVRRDRALKMRAYQGAAIAEYWIVDPVHRQVDFHVLDGGAYSVCLPTDDRYTATALPGFELEIAALWEELDRLTRLGYL